MCGCCIAHTCHRVRNKLVRLCIKRRAYLLKYIHCFSSDVHVTTYTPNWLYVCLHKTVNCVWRNRYLCADRAQSREIFDAHIRLWFYGTVGREYRHEFDRHLCIKLTSHCYTLYATIYVYERYLLSVIHHY